MVLAVSLLFLAAWLYYGFDSTTGALWSDNPMLRASDGWHWSTLNLLCLTFYFIVVNMQVGGFKSFNHLFHHLKLDLKCIFTTRPLVMRFQHSLMSSKIKARWAFIFAVGLSGLSFAAFEYPYVHLLNWFHFGDLMFPVYTYKANPFSPAFIRNIGILLVGGFLTLWISLLLFKSEYFVSKPFHLRINAFTFLLILAASTVWLGWIIYPHRDKIGYDDLEGLDRSLYNYSGKGWTFPEQRYFPQTIYIFVNATKEDPHHVREDLDAWWENDPPVHFLNIMTKYMVSLAVVYPFMVKIKE